MKKKILFNGLGNRGWIGGLYYIKNIMFSCLQNENIMERFSLVLLIDPEHMDTIAAYLIFLNLVGFLIMGEDKRRAKMHRWRISERMLFLVSILGGSIGTWAGMYVFRHKTRHWYFVIGMPLILILQIAGAIWLYRQGLYHL